MMNIETRHLCMHRQIIEKVLLIALHRHWYKGASLHTFSGTLVCVIVSGTAVHLFHRQWYVNESSLYIISGTVVYLFMPSVERWYVLSSVVRRYISFIVSGTSMNYPFISSVVRWYISSCLQWNVGMCYRQWYGGTSLSSSVVRR